MFVSINLVFKTKRTINFVNSCSRREPRLETFGVQSSDHVPAGAAVGAHDFVPGICTGEACPHHSVMDWGVLNPSFQPGVPK